MIAALVGRELRSLRGLFYGAFVLASIACILMALSTNQWELFFLDETLLSFLMIAAIVIAFVTAVMQVTRESSARSVDFLVHRPVSRATIVIAKFTAGMIVICGTLLPQVLGLVVWYTSSYGPGAPFRWEMCYPLMRSLFAGIFIYPCAIWFFLGRGRERLLGAFAGGLTGFLLVTMEEFSVEPSLFLSALVAPALALWGAIAAFERERRRRWSIAGFPGVVVILCACAALIITTAVVHFEFAQSEMWAETQAASSGSSEGRGVVIGQTIFHRDGRVGRSITENGVCRIELTDGTFIDSTGIELFQEGVMSQFNDALYGFQYGYYQSAVNNKFGRRWIEQRVKWDAFLPAATEERAWFCLADEGTLGLAMPNGRIVQRIGPDGICFDDEKMRGFLPNSVVYREPVPSSHDRGNHGYGDVGNVAWVLDTTGLYCVGFSDTPTVRRTIEAPRNAIGWLMLDPQTNIRTQQYNYALRENIGFLLAFKFDTGVAIYGRDGSRRATFDYPEDEKRGSLFTQIYSDTEAKRCVVVISSWSPEGAGRIRHYVLNPESGDTPVLFTVDFASKLETHSAEYSPMPFTLMSEESAREKMFRRAMTVTGLLPMPTLIPTLTVHYQQDLSLYQHFMYGQMMTYWIENASAYSTNTLYGVLVWLVCAHLCGALIADIVMLRRGVSTWRRRAWLFGGLLVGIPVVAVIYWRGSRSEKIESITARGEAERHSYDGMSETAPGAGRFGVVFRALIVREMRMTRTIGIVVFGTASLLLALFDYIKNDDTSYRLMDDLLLVALALSGIAIAGLMALVQCGISRLQRTEAFLRHRPVRPTTIILAKSVSAIFMFATSLLLPYLLYVSWVSTSHGHFGPFEWEMTWPGLSCLLAGFACYPGALWAATGKEREKTIGTVALIIMGAFAMFGASGRLSPTAVLVDLSLALFMFWGAWAAYRAETIRRWGASAFPGLAIALTTSIVVPIIVMLIGSFVMYRMETKQRNTTGGFVWKQELVMPSGEILYVVKIDNRFSGIEREDGSRLSDTEGKAAFLNGLNHKLDFFPYFAMHRGEFGIRWKECQRASWYALMDFNNYMPSAPRRPKTDRYFWRADNGVIERYGADGSFCVTNVAFDPVSAQFTGDDRYSDRTQCLIVDTGGIYRLMIKDSFGVTVIAKAPLGTRRISSGGTEISRNDGNPDNFNSAWNGYGFVSDSSLTVIDSINGTALFRLDLPSAISNSIYYHMNFSDSVDTVVIVGGDRRDFFLRSTGTHLLTRTAAERGETPPALMPYFASLALAVSPMPIVTAAVAVERLWSQGRRVSRFFVPAFLAIMALAPIAGALAGYAAARRETTSRGMRIAWSLIGLLAGIPVVALFWARGPRA